MKSWLYKQEFQQALCKNANIMVIIKAKLTKADLTSLTLPSASKTVEVSKYCKLLQDIDW